MNGGQEEVIDKRGSTGSRPKRPGSRKNQLEGNPRHKNEDIKITNYQ